MVSNFAPEIGECEAGADIAAIISAVGNPPASHTFFFWGFGTVVIYSKNCRKNEYEQK